MKCFFMTEASKATGYGHLFECLTLAEGLRKHDPVFLLYDSDAEAGKVAEGKGFSIEYITPEDIRTHAGIRGSLVILNTRKNKIELQNLLKKSADKLLLIDELGDKEINCDILINFSLCEEWTESYTFLNDASCFTGPDYYPLREEFKMAKGRVAKNRDILVSLGGVDRSRTALSLAGVFSDMDKFTCTYIIGPGCGYTAEDIHKLTHGKADQKVITYPDNFAEVLASHRLLISSGGDTLYEAAYLGVPAVVMWEDYHERTQGQSFLDRGAAVSVVKWDGSDRDNFKMKVNMILDDTKMLDRVSGISERLVDGSGIERIKNIIEKEIAE